MNTSLAEWKHSSGNYTKTSIKPASKSTHCLPQWYGSIKGHEAWWDIFRMLVQMTILSNCMKNQTKKMVNEKYLRSINTYLFILDFLTG